MDAARLLAAFDEQIRRRVDPDGATEVSSGGRVVRMVDIDGGWAGVVWSDLADSDADAVIAAQVGRMAELGVPWEWKHYSYDTPPDLAARLVSAGLTPGPVEALMVAEISDLDLAAGPPPGIRLDRVTEPAGVAVLVGVHDEVFGGDHAALGAALLAGLSLRPPTTIGLVATAAGTPVAAGRLELHHGTDFASLWGGGTVMAWRGRGVFRALVARRARLAADAGFRYLQVDASAQSRPILERLGFVHLADTTPFDHPGR
jgi:hypothetical protein